jgi:alanine racemase
MPRHAAVHVDLDAVEENVRALAAFAHPATLCAVVKADGYGHGAVPVARSALAAGADVLAVALVEEGTALRAAGVDAPVLVLSEPPVDAMADAAAAGLTPTLYTPDGIDAAAAAGGAAGWEVQLKVDTGMHRVGCAPADAVALAERLLGGGLRLGGTFTHLAVADEPDRPETAEQLARYTSVLGDLAAAGVDPGVRHAANSAGLLYHPEARFDMVRVGIAVYGVAPTPAVPSPVPLRPAMSVRTEVSLVKPVPAGHGVSYGLRHVFDRDAVVATVPVGYADGVSRSLGIAGGEVLVGGVRRAVRGVVTMDQLVVEVTDGPSVAVGDEVVLVGPQAGDEVTAEEWAGLLGTIAYEVVCGFGPRLPRRHVGGSAGAALTPSADGELP